MILVSNIERLELDLKNASPDLELKFEDVELIYPSISCMMGLVKEKLEDYNSIKFYLNENSNIEKHRFIESVIHRYMRAAYFERYEIIFY